jgi:hypothetical protein
VLRVRQTVAVVGLAALVAACAPVNYPPPQTMFPRFTSFIDPAFRSVEPARSLLVIAPRLALDERRAVEAAMASAARVRGVEAVVGLDAFPPTRGVPTDDDIAEALRTRGIDAALVFSTEDQRVEVEQGVRTVPRTSTELVFINGRWREVEVRTSQSIPFTRRLPLGQYVAELKVQNGATAWRTEGAVTSNTAQNSFADLAATAGTAVVEALQRDRFLVPPPAPALPPTPGVLPPPPP